MPIDLLIVGPASRDTGGVARYVTEERRILPEDIRPRVFDVRTPPGNGLRRFVLALLVSLFDAARFPFRHRPDVVHVHTSHKFAFYRASYYVLVSKLLWRRPVVLHVHGSGFDDFCLDARGLARRWQSLVFGACDRVVALSAYWKSVLGERVPSHRITVIPNAVDPEAYDPDTDGSPPTVVFVSNLIERKGVPEFTAAIDRLQRDGGPEFDVEIAGDGPLAASVVELASEHAAVTYRGYVSEAEKRHLLNEGSLFVLPTHAEGLPIALLEGMAGGNAVVSTRVGSIPEVVGPENGVVVDPGSTDALVEALGRLLEDDTERTAMAERNRAAVEKEYSWSVVGDRLAATVRELAP